MVWADICLKDNVGWRFSLVSMVSINLEIWFYGVEMSDVIAVTRCAQQLWMLPRIIASRHCVQSFAGSLRLDFRTLP